jgi:hypothetical protein
MRFMLAWLFMGAFSARVAKEENSPVSAGVFNQLNDAKNGSQAQGVCL